LISFDVGDNRALLSNGETIVQLCNLSTGSE